MGDLQSVNIGVDFGGGDAGHAFVATGIPARVSWYRSAGKREAHAEGHTAGY